MSRSRLVSLLLRITAVAALFSWLASPGNAQGVPWYTIPLPVPNGFVDAATGNIHFEIVLGSLPQRNGDTYVSKLTYDSTAYVFSGNAGGFIKTGFGWNTLLGNSHRGTGSMNGQTTSCPSGYPNGNINTWNGFYFQDAHFTIHPIVPNPNVFTRQHSCFSTSGVPDPNNSGDSYPSAFGVAADGSGYTFTVTNYTQMQISAADGTLVYDNTGDRYTNEYPVDPSGNFGTSAPNLSAIPTVFTLSFDSPGTYTNTGKASDGSTLTYTYVHTANSVAEIIGNQQMTGTEIFLTSIGLPDGTQYSFTYDTGTTGTHLGDLLSMTLPSGGVVSFTHVPYPGEFEDRTSSVTYGGATWNLGYVLGSNNLQVTSTVLSPQRYDSASKTYVSDKTEFISIPNADRPVQTAHYYSGSSTLLKTVTTTYDPNGNLLPMLVTTTLNDTGQSSSISYQYFDLMRDYVTQKQETDFNGNVRTTVINRSGCPFLQPCSVNVYAGSNTSGTPISSTVYNYDEYSSNYCKNGVPMLTTVTGAYGHDDTFTRPVGKVTTTQRLVCSPQFAGKCI